MKHTSLKTFTPDQRLELILTALDRLTLMVYTNLEHRAIYDLPDNNLPSNASGADENGLQWTYSKIGLVELIYSLKELGAFNHGKAELKSITACFESMFAVDLGNISSSFQEILER